MADDFSRALAKTAASQLAELAGYTVVQESAGDILGELLIKYITELSATAHGYAELAQRTGMNVHDVLLALDDLGTNAEELNNYLKHLTPEANTFVHTITDYPIKRAPRPHPTWQDKGEKPPAHIPAFLPAFPDKHNYKHTPTFAGHIMNPDKQAQALRKDRKQAEASLLKMHHATMGAGRTAGGSAGGAPTSDNPYLAPPEVLLLAAPPAGTPVPGTGAYAPDTATKAFAALITPGENAEGGDADGGFDFSVTVDNEDLRAPQELDWRYVERVNERGPTQPLAPGSDYGTLAFNAVSTYTVGAEEPDALEEAAQDTYLATTHGGQQRKRKSIYGGAGMNPNKRTATDVLDKAKNPTSGGDGDE